MSLLRELQSALAKVDGNVRLWVYDGEYDEYWCVLGQHRVYEHQYNHKHSCCQECWNSDVEDGRL